MSDKEILKAPELDFERETSTLLPKLLALHLKDLRYTLTDFKAITKMHEPETARLYNLSDEHKRAPLRLV